jgi:DNA-binding transcriptional ArsR family regulator
LGFVPRASTTSDVFNAVAEARRRQILVFLADQEHPVGDLVIHLKMRQPSVSKHLRVLHQVGLVRAHRKGRLVLYRTNAAPLRHLHEWTKYFERFWTQQLLRIKERAEAQASHSSSDFAKEKP